jgi:hypothetical protein
MPTVECNTTAAQEHVSKAERCIHTIKERVRGLVMPLPFMHIPRCMKIKFVYFIVLWLNAFPVRTGILAWFSPRELLVQWQLDYKKHCRVLYRALIVRYTTNRTRQTQWLLAHTKGLLWSQQATYKVV